MIQFRAYTLRIKTSQYTFFRGNCYKKHVCHIYVWLTLCMVANVLWRAVSVTVISTRVYRGSLSRSGAESEWFCSWACVLLHLDCGVEVTGLDSAWGMCRKWIQQKNRIMGWSWSRREVIEHGKFFPVYIFRGKRSCVMLPSVRVNNFSKALLICFSISPKSISKLVWSLWERTMNQSTLWNFVSKRIMDFFRRAPQPKSWILKKTFTEEWIFSLHKEPAHTVLYVIVDAPSLCLRRSRGLFLFWKPRCERPSKRYHFSLISI